MACHHRSLLATAMHTASQYSLLGTRSVCCPIAAQSWACLLSSWTLRLDLIQNVLSQFTTLLQTDVCHSHNFILISRCPEVDCITFVHHCVLNLAVGIPRTANTQIPELHNPKHYPASSTSVTYPTCSDSKYNLHRSTSCRLPTKTPAALFHPACVQFGCRIPLKWHSFSRCQVLADPKHYQRQGVLTQRVLPLGNCWRQQQECISTVKLTDQKRLASNT